jgi:hypothetical protein
VEISAEFAANFYTSANVRMELTNPLQTLPVTLRSNFREKAEPAKKLQLSHTLAWSELNYMGFCNS